jgi:hypothetical protein
MLNYASHYEDEWGTKGIAPYILSINWLFNDTIDIETI